MHAVIVFKIAGFVTVTDVNVRAAGFVLVRYGTCVCGNHGYGYCEIFVINMVIAIGVVVVARAFWF